MCRFFFFRRICHIAPIVAVVRDGLLNVEDHRAGRLAAPTIHSAVHAHAHGISDHHDMALSCTCRSPCPYRHAGCVHLTLGRPVVLAPPLPRSALTTMWLVKPHHSRRTEITDLSRLLKNNCTAGCSLPAATPPLPPQTEADRVTQ